MGRPTIFWFCQATKRSGQCHQTTQRSDQRHQTTRGQASDIRQQRGQASVTRHEEVRPVPPDTTCPGQCQQTPRGQAVSLQRRRACQSQRLVHSNVGTIWRFTQFGKFVDMGGRNHVRRDAPSMSVAAVGPFQCVDHLEEVCKIRTIWQRTWEGETMRGAARRGPRCGIFKKTQSAARRAARIVFEVRGQCNSQWVLFSGPVVILQKTRGASRRVRHI